MHLRTRSRVTLPALHHSLVHRAGIDVVVNRSGGRRAPFVGNAKQPEGLADCLAAAAREGFSIAKIGRHAPHNARREAAGCVRRASERVSRCMQNADAAKRRSRAGTRPLAVVAAMALYITLPPRLTIGPVWAAPLLYSRDSRSALDHRAASPSRDAPHALLEHRAHRDRQLFQSRVGAAAGRRLLSSRALGHASAAPHPAHRRADLAHQHPRILGCGTGSSTATAPKRARMPPRRPK